MIGTLEPLPADLTPASIPAPAALAATVAHLDDVATRMASVLATLEPAAALIQQAPPMIAVAVDTFDALVADGRKQGIDVDERLRDTLRLVERLTAPETMRGLEVMLKQVHVLERLAPMLEPLPAALDEAQRTAQPVGFFGALRALGDPDVQRAIGLSVSLARVLGRASRTTSGGNTP